MSIVEFETELDRYQVARIRESVDGEPDSRPLGVLHLNEYTDHHAKFSADNVLLCSLCDRPAVAIYLIPWCVLTNEVRALCLECTDEPDSGYHIDVEKLWHGWNATILHLAGKFAGGGSIQLMRWFGYSGMCRFLGFDDLHYWPVARGVITPELRDQILERDGYKCRRCGSTENLTIDHIRPVSAGGFTTATNLQVLCQPCNSHKGGVRRRKRRPTPRKSPVPVPAFTLAQRGSALCDRAAEVLAAQPQMASQALAESLGVDKQYLNRVLRRDDRFTCVAGNGRGHPTVWSLVGAKL